MKRIHDASDVEEETHPKDNLESRQEGPFDDLVEECFFESYHCILCTCESNNAICPYLMDSGVPVFLEPVLREMDSTRLSDLFGLFADHFLVPRGLSSSVC